MRVADGAATRTTSTLSVVVAVFVALTAITAAMTVLAVERSPLIWADEAYLVSAAVSVSRGDTGVPTVLPPGSWNRPFPRAYGPVFFRLAAVAVDVLGVRRLTVRILSLAGAFIACGSAFALVRAFGGSWPWAWLAAALIWLSPEMGTSATNGRMDALAAGFELLGLAFSVSAAARQRPGRARILLSSAAGLSWACAALSTPRTFPLFLAAGIVAIVIWASRTRDRQIANVWAVALLHVAVAMAAWLLVYRITPREWLSTLVDGATNDSFNAVLSANPRVWGLSAKTAFTPFTALAAFVCARALSGGRTRAASLLLVDATMGLAIVHAVGYAAMFNYAFFSGLYFSVLLLAAAVAACSSFDLPPARRSALAIGMVGVGCVSLVMRSAKLVEVWASWGARDPAPLEQFVRARIPPGSLVFGEDAVYYFAVTRSDSVFRTSSLNPYPGSPTIGRRPRGIRSTNDDLRPGVAAANRYLLWPADEVAFPFPREFSCARDAAVSRFEPPQPRENFVTRLPIFATFAYLHSYPATVLYRLSDTCHAE